MIKKMVVCIVCMFFVLSGIAACDLKPGKKVEPDVVFATTPHKVVREMLKLAGVTKDDIVYDLGSGDGRIVIAAARDFGARGVGVELDPELVAESIENAKKAGVGEKVRFIKEDIFVADIREASVIALYMLPELNKQLTPKFFRELKPGARIVAHRFGAGNWKPDMVLSAFDTTVLLWVIPANAQGEWRVTLRNEKGAKGYMLSLRQNYQMAAGTIKDEEKKFELRDARLYGEEITMKVEDTIAGRPLQMKLEGVVRGDAMEGTASVAGGRSPGTYAWKGTRIAR